MQLMMAGDVLMLGIFDSVALVAAYSLTKYVPDALIRLVAIVVFGIAPGLGGIIGAGKLPKAARVRGEIMLFTWLFATVAGATILLWNQDFVGLWVGTAYDTGPLATLLIVVMVTQLTLIRNDANIIDLTLNIRRKVLLGVLSVALSLALAALLDWLLADRHYRDVSGLYCRTLNSLPCLSVDGWSLSGYSLGQSTARVC